MYMYDASRKWRINIFQSADMPIYAKTNVKVVVVVFAGTKVKAFAKSGKEYLKYIENSSFRITF